MRVGINPAKTADEVREYGRHRVIIPIYIPHFDGYFEHALEVLRLCLASLRHTAAERAAITLIANGCHPAVVEDLQQQFAEGWINQLLINQLNRGKTDAIVAAARGSFEPLVTFADADVLFRPNWLAAVDELFEAFPEAGFVSPFPSASGLRYHTSATFLEALVRRELSFAKVVLDEDLDRFAASIGQPNFFPPEFRAAQLILRRRHVTACVGAGHFVCTVRREVVNGMPATPCLRALDGASDQLWLDAPGDRLGYWRLSTPQAWVNHMGNCPEKWMHEELAATLRQPLPPPRTPANLPPIPWRWPRWVPLRLRLKLLQGTKREWVQQIVYRHLGYPLTAGAKLKLS